MVVVGGCWEIHKHMGQSLPLKRGITAVNPIGEMAIKDFAVVHNKKTRSVQGMPDIQFKNHNMKLVSGLNLNYGGGCYQTNTKWRNAEVGDGSQKSHRLPGRRGRMWWPL